MAQAVLLKEYKELSKEKWVTITLADDNLFKWNIALIVVNPDSMYYGGYFRATISFNKNFPYTPPDFRFKEPLWHPNIYPDGRICISILHAPGDDAMSGETAGERWSPAQRVESVLISILSLLDDPEINSPANVDASVMFRDRKDEFRDRVQHDVDESKKHIPEGFIMPTHESTKPVVQKPVDDDDFWQDSDAEADFGDFDDDDDDDDDVDDVDLVNGSDTDEADNNDTDVEDFEDDDDDEDELNPSKATPKPAKHNRERLDSEMTEPDEV